MFAFGHYLNHTACIDASGRSMTYGSLNELAGRIGGLVGPRQLVFSLCSNTIGSIAGYAAFLGNDDASLLLDARMDHASFDNLARTYHPRYIWAPTVCPLAGDAETMFEAEGYALRRTRLDGPAIADDLAVLLSTSGSTGSPKLVRLTKDNLRSNALSIVEYLRITDREHPILGLPMHYVFGLSIINSHLLSGSTLLLTGASFVQREFWDFANAHAFTSYSGTPFAFETIIKLGIWKQGMPSLRTLTSSGGALRPEHIRFLEGIFGPRGVKLYMMYGQTEAAGRMAYLEPDRIETKAGSIGKAIPGGRLSLVNKHGKAIAKPDTVGELVYEGPNVCLGYAEKAEDLTNGDENDGILHTGDLAYRDADGFHYLVGRKTRFIKLFGHRIGLDHVETLLRPILTDCACVGDDTRLTVFTTDIGVDEDAVTDLLAFRTRISRKAFLVRRVERMPRAENGKVQYEQLRLANGIRHHGQ